MCSIPVLLLIAGGAVICALGTVFACMLLSANHMGREEEDQK